jgi:hypothetical protein
MSRPFRGTREFIPTELPEVSAVINGGPSGPGFLDIVAKFGPLLIAIIAVAFCFYIYKKVIEMDKAPSAILQNFIDDQTQTNFHIQESYNTMVEQFNNLSGVVHTSLVKNGTIETQISPSPSVINEKLVNEVNEVNEVHEVNEVNEVHEVNEVNEVNDVIGLSSSIPVAFNETLDNASVSEVSVTMTGSTKAKRGRKPKNEVNF